MNSRDIWGESGLMAAERKIGEYLHRTGLALRSQKFLIFNTNRGNMNVQKPFSWVNKYLESETIYKHNFASLHCHSGFKIKQ